jgi:HAMP domain-containing protein
MTRDDAIAILGLINAQLDPASLKQAYRARAKDAFPDEEKLSQVNIAHDLLDAEFAQNTLPAIADSNQALAQVVRAQTQQIREQTASTKLAEAVKGAFVQLSAQPRMMRDALVICTAVAGALTFLFSSDPTLLETLGLASKQTKLVMLALLAYAAAGAFFFNLRIQRIQDTREAVIRQLSRMSNRQLLLDEIFAQEASLTISSFSRRLRNTLENNLEANRFRVGRVINDLAGEFEDLITSTGEITVSKASDGERVVRRSSPD